MDKEKIKTFLRPDLRKLVIIIFLFIFFPIPHQTMSVGCLQESLEAVCTHYWTVMFYGFDIFRIVFFTQTLSYKDYPLVIVFSFLILTLSYLVSCLVISVYDKFRTIK